MTQATSEPVVVITGASGGIGAAVARELARRYASLVLVARRADALELVVAQCGAKAVGLVADVTIRGDVEGVVEESLSRFGQIDVWINNVGQGITRLPSALTEDDLDAMLRVNVKSALYGMQAVLPHFRSVGRGHVINVSSMLGRIPSVPFRAAYSASKHFLNALTEDFRAEVQQAHPEIEFSLVSPGVVRTAFGANARHGGPDSRELPNSQSVEEVAVVIADLVESRRRDVYTRRGSRERVAQYFEALGEDP